MIVTFSIENFLSFNEEETFSLVASKRFSEDHENHLVPIPGSDELLTGSFWSRAVSRGNGSDYEEGGGDL